jgi:hypothetical protein
MDRPALSVGYGILTWLVERRPGVASPRGTEPLGRFGSRYRDEQV